MPEEGHPEPAASPRVKDLLAANVIEAAVGAVFTLLPR
jgi:hypothetical protein